MATTWNVGAPRPTVIQPSQYASGRGTGLNVGEPGIGCCGCRICTCVSLGFLRTKAGWLKIIELVLVTICMILALRYGLTYSDILGFSLELFLVTCSACIILISVLIFTYTISANSFNLIRSSVLEVVFNSLVSILYLVSASLLSYTVQAKLYKLYRVEVHFSVYPAMTACYVLSFTLGIIHAIDAIVAKKASS